MKESAEVQKAGYVVQIASPTGESWGSKTVTLKPDLKLSDVRVADYQGTHHTHRSVETVVSPGADYKVSPEDDHEVFAS